MRKMLGKPGVGWKVGGKWSEKWWENGWNFVSQRKIRDYVRGAPRVCHDPFFSIFFGELLFGTKSVIRPGDRGGSLCLGIRMESNGVPPNGFLFGDWILSSQSSMPSCYSSLVTIQIANITSAVNWAIETVFLLAESKLRIHTHAYCSY